MPEPELAGEGPGVAKGGCSGLHVKDNAPVTRVRGR